jgi:glycerate dehydrogenase
MMKAVVLDGYTLNPGDLNWHRLESLCETTVYDRTAYNICDKDLIIERALDAEIIFTNKTPLTKDILKALPKLKYIGVLATGYNVVDTQAAKEQGIVVTNIPSYGTQAVAQMTLALLLELCHHVGSHSQAVKNGEWGTNKEWCFWNYPLIELAGKTMGIIGFGRIGQNVAKIAQALGMNILAYSRSRHSEFETPTLKYAGLDELFTKSDVISLHCPLFEDTKALINKETLAKMKSSALLINTARGPLIVDEDLAEALNTGRIAGAALDVVSAEPISLNNPLLTAKNCIITPHIAWAAKETRARLMDIAMDNLAAFLKGQPIHVVNL